jgi:hypothetical protein
MCAFDSQAQGTDFATWSEWCHLFDSDEWEVLGYAKDVGRWYQVGEGSVSPPQASHIRTDDVAFRSYYGCMLQVIAKRIRELLGRLTDSEPQSGPTINSTLDSDPKTFPRGGKRVFAVSHHTYTSVGSDKQDFTHDNEMIQILTAMRLLTVS